MSLKTFLIIRRSGWTSAEDLEAAAARSTALTEQMSEVRWIRSYVTNEGDTIGAVCVYQATSEAELRAFNVRAALPVDEVVPVVDTVVVRPDPDPG